MAAIVKGYVANQGLDSNRGTMPQPEMSKAMARAVEGLGGAISDVGAHLKRRQDEKDAFAANIKEREFELNVRELETEAVNNAPADATGIHDGVVGTFSPSGKTTGTFDASFDKYLAEMPASKRADFAAKKELYREATSQRLAQAQLGAEQSYYRVEIERTQNQLLTSLAQSNPRDDASYETFKASGLDIIEKSRLPPLEKDVAKLNWEAKASEALFQLKLSKDPEFADGARAALGLGVDTIPDGVANATSGREGTKALIREKEGFRTTAYWDENAYRTGFGSDTTTRADGTIERVTKNTVVTREDAERDLERRAAEFENTAIRQVGRREWGALHPAAQAALTSLTYNYGSLKASVVNAVKSGNLEAIAVSVENLKTDNNGINAKRRLNEAALIRGKGNLPAVDKRFDAIPFERRLTLANSADDAVKVRDNERKVAAILSIEDAVTNAPTAIFNTGSYEGKKPDIGEFMAAYGPDEGADRYDQFKRSMETSETAYGMRHASLAEINATVAAAVPTSSGDDAVAETERYNTLAAAAKSIRDARDADPADYVRKLYPNIDEAFKNIENDNDYRMAVAMSVAAQEKLGIVDIKPLPKDAAQYTVDQFKDVNLTEEERFGNITNALLFTPDPEQRQAIFEQLVEAGLPAHTEGAFEALARGDKAGGTRLLRAAMINMADLPGKSSATPAEVDGAVQRIIMDDNKIGDVFYDLDSAAENFVRSERDAKLISAAVEVRMRVGGEKVDDAVKAVAKDLYGDVQVVTGDNRVNMRVYVPSKADPDVVIDGLARTLPDVRKAVVDYLATGAPQFTEQEAIDLRSSGQAAVLDAVPRVYADYVANEGYFRNYGNGYAFIDPYTGDPVADKDNKPIIFRPKDTPPGTPDAPFAARTPAETGAGPSLDDSGNPVVLPEARRVKTTTITRDDPDIVGR